jgi:hypothetical protein
MPMNEIEPKPCTIRVVAEGKAEECPRDRCVFWEPRTPWTDGSCVLDRTGVDINRPDLAGYLIEVRDRLEQVRELSEAEEAHREFSRRLGRDV